MDPHPRISIVTPSYNQKEFIEDNLESVLRQNYDAVEHIVVDGGSTDGTIEILEEYEDEYDLKWISEEDRGQSHAINKGVGITTGEWIGWQNSDDYYQPGAFTSVVEAIREEPDLDVVYGDVLVVDENGDEVDRIFNIPPSPFVQRYWSLFTSNQATFFRRSVFNEVGPLSEDLEFTMDADLFWRLIQSNMNMRHIPEFIGVFRKQSDAKTYDQSVKSIRREMKEYRNRPIYEYILPKNVLQFSAICIKAGYLVRENRWQAFDYNLRKRILLGSRYF